MEHGGDDAFGNIARLKAGEGVAKAVPAGFHAGDVFDDGFAFCEKPGGGTGHADVRIAGGWQATRLEKGAAGAFDFEAYVPPDNFHAHELEVVGHVTEAQYNEAASLMGCCIVLDFKSTDTVSNASEAAFWIAASRVRSVRLVTSDWHMRRAALELARVAPTSLVIVQDAVPSHPSFEILVLEYNKLLTRAARLGAG